MIAILPALHSVQARIAAACDSAGRSPDSVNLLAVSKGQDAVTLAALYAAGHTRFGESYVQEALPKITQVLDLLNNASSLREGGAATTPPAPEWHFIGPLQSNKTAAIAQHFSWVHSIDRLKIAERLAAQRPPALPPLQVCVQVNISGEASKSGCLPSDCAALCAAITRLPGLQLRGLMTLPEAQPDALRQRQPFAALRHLRDAVQASLGYPLPVLSMGMSDDLEAAIREGATWVRVGSALFGPRLPPFQPG